MMWRGRQQNDSLTDGWSDLAVGDGLVVDIPDGHRALQSQLALAPEASCMESFTTVCQLRSVMIALLRTLCNGAWKHGARHSPGSHSAPHCWLWRGLRGRPLCSSTHPLLARGCRDAKTVMIPHNTEMQGRARCKDVAVRGSGCASPSFLALSSPAHNRPAQ